MQRGGGGVPHICVLNPDLPKETVRTVLKSRIFLEGSALDVVLENVNIAFLRLAVRGKAKTYNAPPVVWQLAG